MTRPIKNNYRQHSEIWNFNRGMIPKVDHAVNSVRKHQASKPAGEIKILDVGCGVGTVSLPLASEGYSVTAIDIDKDSVEFCEQKANAGGIASIEFVKGMLQEELPAEQAFDWAFLADVLEHIDEPVEFLTMLKGYLKPGGFLWISVPNEVTALSTTPLNLFTPYVRTKMAVRHLGKNLLRAFGLLERVQVSRDALEEPTGDGATTASAIKEFKPAYFNYSLNQDSPHVQWFTHDTVQDTVRAAGFDVVSINGGNLFYTCFPIFHVMDKAVWMAELDYKLAQRTPNLAGCWWVVCQVPEA